MNEAVAEIVEDAERVLFMNGDNDDLRKLANDLFQSLNPMKDADQTALQWVDEEIGKILTALQSVQRAEREKAEGLKDALEDIIDLMDGAPEDVVSTAKSALATFDSKDGAA